MLASLLLQGAVAQAAESIRIPVITSLTGPLAVLGQDSKKAVEIAEQMINAGGGVAGRPLALEVVDTQGRPEIARREMERLGRSQKPPVVMACEISAGTAGAAQYGESAKIPLVNAGAVSADILARGYAWYFAQQITGDDEAATTIAYLKDVTGNKKLTDRRLALLYEDSPRGAGTGERIRKMLTDEGAKLVSEVTYNRADRNLLPVMRKVQDSNPELVIWIGYTEDAVAGLKAAKQLDFKPFVLGVGGGLGDPRLPELVDPEIIKALHVANVDYFNPDIKRAQAFRDAYRKKYGTEPSSYAAMCYAGVTTLKLAYEQALKGGKDPTPEAMRDILRTIDVPGDQLVTSSKFVRFDKTGRNIGGQELVAQWVDGTRKETVFPPDIAVGKPVLLP